VSGKGVSASLVSTVLGGIFNSYDFTKGFPEFIVNLNSYLYETFESDKFVTAIISDFDCKTGLILLYDMGHSIAFLFREGKLLRLDLSGTSTFPLGMSDGLVPSAAKLVMKSSDILLLMTDGIEEQVNNKGEAFGQQRVQELFAYNRYADISLQKKFLFQAIDQFRGEYPQYDDITVMMMRYK
jgi:phosphoserine phosphatase RsbU/P